MHPQQFRGLARDFMEANGYAYFPDIFSSTEISRLGAELSIASLKRSRAGARHVLSHPAVRSLANTAQLSQIARAVLGNGAVPFRATLFDKTPTSNWFVAWHQDTALPLIEKKEIVGWGPWSKKGGILYAHAPKEALEQVLALRVHLDDSTASNGPLRVLPGTHRNGVFTDSEVQRHASHVAPIPCTVGSGGVIAMRPLVIHASSKSESDLPRRVLHIEFCSQLQIISELRLAIA